MSAKTRRPLRRALRIAGTIIVINSLLASAVSGETATMSVQNAPVEKVPLEKGQVIALALSTTLDSGVEWVGKPIELRLVHPLMSNGKTVVPAGWTVPAHISKVRRAGKKNCRGGKVEWKLEPMTAVDGTEIKLMALRWRPYRNGRPVDAVHVRSAWESVGKVVEDVELAPAVVVAFLIFLPSGLAMGWGEGEPCSSRPGLDEVIPAGTIRYAAIAKNVSLTAKSATAH